MFTLRTQEKYWLQILRVWTVCRHPGRSCKILPDSCCLLVPTPFHSYLLLPPPNPPLPHHLPPTSLPPPFLPQFWVIHKLHEMDLFHSISARFFIYFSSRDRPVDPRRSGDLYPPPENSNEARNTASNLSSLPDQSREHFALHEETLSTTQCFLSPHVLFRAPRRIAANHKRPPIKSRDLIGCWLHTVRIFDSFKGDGLLKGRVIQRRETSLVVLDGWELRVTDTEAEEEQGGKRSGSWGKQIGMRRNEGRREEMERLRGDR